MRSLYPWILLFIGAAAVAGPINPPPGPVTSTGKTIGQTEPRVIINALPVTISQPGSYYLGADLQGTGGITITVGDVTIDMAGFSISAAPGANGDGIRSTGVVDNITIRNGAVSGWPGDGIDLQSATGCFLQDLASNNNTLNGFTVGAGVTMIRCTASGNGGSGIGGSDNGKVMGSTSISNGYNGITFLGYASISDCIAVENGNVGVNVGEGASITNTKSSRNKHGLSTKDSAIVVNCAVVDNDGEGIVVGTSSEVRSCNATGNSGFGMIIGRSSSVLDSSSGFNHKHGIVLDSGAVARGNACRENQGDGIFVDTGSVGAVIERNQVFFNKGIGINVSGPRCIIYSNVASTNGLDYQLRSDSSYGVITNVAGDGPFAVTNSFANLRY